MLRGLTTVTYQAPDLAAVEQWHTELLGFGVLGFVYDPHHPEVMEARR